MRIKPEIGHFVSLPEITKLLDISNNLDIFSLLVEKHGIIEGETEIEKLKNKEVLKVEIVNETTIKINSGQVVGCIYDHFLIDEKVVPVKRWKLLEINETQLSLDDLFFGYAARPVFGSFYVMIMLYEKEAYKAYEVGIGLEEEKKICFGEGSSTTFPFLYKINKLEDKSNIQTKDLLEKGLEIQDFIKFGENYYRIQSFFNNYILLSEPLPTNVSLFSCVKKIRRRFVFVPSYRFTTIATEHLNLLRPIREQFIIIGKLTVGNGIIKEMTTEERDTFSMRQIISIKDILSLIFITKEIQPVDPVIPYIKTIINSVDYTIQEEAREEV
ncbi:MAG: hypothetical protein QXI58_00475 [Candidatus Micrarchaeia archaeon]